MATSNLGSLLGAEPQQNLAGDVSAGVKAGIDLATAAETIEGQKMKVKEQQMELATKQDMIAANSLKSVIYAKSPNLRKANLDAMEARMNKFGIPMNRSAIEATLSDEATLLQMQKAYNDYATGKVSTPGAVSGFIGGESAQILQDQLEAASRAAAGIEQKNEFEMKKQAAHIQGQKDIAAMGFQKADVKEAQQIRKEKRAETKQLNEDFSNVEKTLQDLKEAKSALEAYSKSSTAGTGPLATVAGAKKYFSEKTETLDSKLKKLSLDQMVKMFSGMSKAVDTGAERRAFEVTQPSITLDDSTNLEILNKQIEAMESLEKKIRNAKQGITSFEASDAKSKAIVDKFMKQHKLGEEQREAATQALIDAGKL